MAARSAEWLTSQGTSWMTVHRDAQLATQRAVWLVMAIRAHQQPVPVQRTPRRRHLAHTLLSLVLALLLSTKRRFHRGERLDPALWPKAAAAPETQKRCRVKATVMDCHFGRATFQQHHITHCQARANLPVCRQAQVRGAAAKAKRVRPRVGLLRPMRRTWRRDVLPPLDLTFHARPMGR